MLLLFLYPDIARSRITPDLVSADYSIFYFNPNERVYVARSLAATRRRRGSRLRRLVTLFVDAAPRAPPMARATRIVAFVIFLCVVHGASGALDARDVSKSSFFDVDARALERAAHNALWRIDGRRIVARSRVLSSTDLGFTLTTNATTTRSGGRVRATVSTTATANATFAEHWIGAYSPAGADPTKTAPVKYAVLGRVDGYATTGSASVVFETLTHRAATYDFVLFANAPNATTMMEVARSAPVHVEDALAPVWPRVTLPTGWGGSTTERGASARVTWQSGRNASHGARLTYRVGNGAYAHVPATTTTYDARDLCGAPANSFGYRHPGYVHTAAIVARPGDSIEYFARDAHGESDRFTMRMPPAESKDAKTTLALFADMGRGSNDDAETWRAYGQPSLNVSAALERDARDDAIDAVFLFGDLSYATGYASVWDEWAAQITPWASRVPFISNLGNHEADSSNWPESRVADEYGVDDSGGECAVPATRLYPTPRAGPDADWFAVTFGSIRVVSMNTEVDFSPASAQGEWLKRELSSIDRAKTPWVVLGGHRPGLVDSTDGPEDRETKPGMKNPSDLSVMREIQTHVWPLLVEYDVNAVFWGHNHAYQRSCAWRGSTSFNVSADEGCAAFSRLVDGVATYSHPGGAPVSVLVGTGGAPHTKNAIGASFMEKELYEYGYVRLTAFNRTHLYGEYQDASADGGVLDAFFIVRDRIESDDDLSSLAGKLAHLTDDLRTWRDTTYVMATFVCATLAIGAWLAHRHWALKASQRKYNILEYDDDGDVDGV